MREVITICIGGAGIRIGNAFWELLCLEHGIQRNGMPGPDAQGRTGDAHRSFFAEMASGKLVPRVVMVDTEPTCIDEVRIGAYRELFHPEQLINGKESAAGNFARGYHSVGLELVDRVMDKVHKLARACSDLQGFIIVHSLGGGTGSGLTAHVMKRLAMEYAEQIKVQFAVFPAPQMQASLLETYNAGLCTHFTFDHSQCCFIIDNEAIYDIARRYLDIERPSYISLNRIIARAMADITASLRFESDVMKDLRELVQHLIPYPRLHFPLISYAPILSANKAHHGGLSTQEITRAVFEPSSQFVKCDPQAGKYMSCCLLYRGDVRQEDVADAVAGLKARPSLQFVDWSPTGFQTGINPQPVQGIPGGDMAPVSRSVVMLSNTTAMASLWARLDQKFDLMYQKRAFVDWYLREGMEEGEFNKVIRDMAGLEKDYQEAGGDAA